MIGTFLAFETAAPLTFGDGREPSGAASSPPRRGLSGGGS